MSTTYEFRVVDFRPAPTGWRIACITSDGLVLEPMPGWLIREEVECNTRTGDIVTRTGSRDVVAAVCLPVDSDVQPATVLSDFWFVLGPGQPDPTPEETAAEVARRELYANARRAQKPEMK